MFRKRKVAPFVNHCFGPLNTCSLVGSEWETRTTSVKLFKFKAMWLCDPRCADVVSDAWEHG